MAQEAVIGSPNENPFDFRLLQIETIERFAALVAEAEREECAKLCDHEMAEQGYGSDGWYIAKALAETICARGKENK
jgi:hypothetical protein